MLTHSASGSAAEFSVSPACPSVAATALSSPDHADHREHAVYQERRHPTAVVMHFVGEYVLAGGETSGWGDDHLARVLAATAARDQWSAGDWQQALDRLHTLAQPGGAFLGGNPVLAQAIALCRREVQP